LLQPMVDVSLSAMKYYTGMEALIRRHGGIVSRTGYTGEDGCELIVGSSQAAGVWEALLDAGQALGAMPAGLGCRDTLRLEAAMPLYGHELTEQIDPFQAGLDFAVDLEGRNFPGHAALVRVRQATNRPKRVGLELEGKRVPREGYRIVADGRQVGQVTSGTFSPTLDKPIAMGYLDPAQAAPGTEVAIDIRGREEPARVVKLPFYRRSN
jgi:aminomethyltransferase